MNCSNLILALASAAAVAGCDGGFGDSSAGWLLLVAYGAWLWRRRR